MHQLQELNATGTVLANLLTGLGIDEFFTRTNSAGTRTLLGDALGSTLALADNAGTLQTTYTYEPFGASTATGQTNTSTYQYTGRENDGTGLDYYRARYYHPTRQRFISEDPIGVGGGQANLYAYVANNPVRFSDSMGLRIDWSDQVLRNPSVVRNLRTLNDEIVGLGIRDADFTLRVSGGDRYRNCLGTIMSASDGKRVRRSVQDSKHLYENGAIAVDLVVTGINMPTFRAALPSTFFNPERTESNYPDDPHVHIELYQLFRLPLTDVPHQLSGRYDVCR
jgi:RHS repeat-associated protein